MTAIVEQSGAGPFYRAEASYASVLRELKLLDGESVFEHPGITPWRELRDRQNCTLDTTLADGRFVRLHVKRWKAGWGTRGPRQEERGIKLLQQAGIATVAFAAAGQLPDGRGFVITEDLSGYDDAEKLIERKAVSFDAVRDALADIAAMLHKAKLHHRDLYLCHFFLKTDTPAADVRLIDCARVQQLPRFFRWRWIVKDLAQFWFSTTQLDITDAQRDAWLKRYCQQTGNGLATTRKAVVRKAAAIARHDAKLNKNQPTRNVSIPR